jgi:DNA helicase HerA-like ATPase
MSSLVIPNDTLLQHIIALGKTGSGKSSKLRHIIEHLLDQDLPVCILDPKGDWWGLKSSADGKSAGYSIVIFGGEHADVPINERAGSQVAELVATGNRPCLIDLGGWTVKDRARFFIDFAATLFKVSRGHRYLAIDEAHNFAPQAGRGDMKGDLPMMLHWANSIVCYLTGKPRGCWR